MSGKDYYAILEVSKIRLPRRNQEGIQKAGFEIPP